MKSIKIDLKAGVSDGALKEISEALIRVNGKASSFTINGPQRVIDMAGLGESHLDQREVRAGERAGTTVTYHPAGPAKHAYKYSATSTEIVLRRKGGTAPVWYLDEVRRVDVYPAAPFKFDVKAPAAAAVAAVKRLLASLGHTAMPVVDDAEKIAA